MQTHIDTTHKHLGELASMSNQTQEAERKILARAEEMLSEVERDLPAARRVANDGGEDHYMHLIAQRGRLNQVIALARKNLA